MVIDNGECGYKLLKLVLGMFVLSLLSTQTSTETLKHESALVHMAQITQC